MKLSVSCGDVHNVKSMHYTEHFSEGVRWLRIIAVDSEGGKKEVLTVFIDSDTPNPFVMGQAVGSNVNA